MPLEQIKSGIATAVDTVSGGLKNSLSFLSDIKDAGWEKANTLVNDILGLAPLIEVTGFSMKDVSVDVTIPPSITISFIKERDVDPATIETLLEENKDKDILSLIVRGLQKADSIQQGMKLSHYKFRGVGMKVGLPPDISLKFTREENQ
jgi:hypothetical protein